MTTPDLPPLPTPWANTYHGPAFTADQMRDYALAAVEQYRKSLVPVAWITAPHGALRYDHSFRLKGPQTLDWRIALYRLDEEVK